MLKKLKLNGFMKNYKNFIGWNCLPKAPPPSIAERIRASADEFFGNMSLPFRAD